MVPLAELWLPVLLSGVFVFLASSVIHMATPWHKGDAKGMPGEDSVLDAMRAAGMKPGHYMFPWCASMKDFQGEEMQRKLDRGPVGYLTVMGPAGWNMGPAMLFWFLYCLLVAAFTGYLAGHALEPGAEYGKVQQVAATAGILGFAFWHIPVSIWHGRSWGTTLRFLLDGVLYGLLVGGTFGWLWPAAA